MSKVYIDTKYFKHPALFISTDWELVYYFPVKPDTKVALLNSAVIPHGEEGIYIYAIIDNINILKELIQVLKEQKAKIDSYIGYETTKEYIKEQLKLDLQLNRDSINIKDYDFCIVVRLKYRVQKPEQKGKFKPNHEDFEIGILFKQK